MITLYDHPLSPYGQKVKIALLEKGIEFEAPQPDALGSGTTAGTFAGISPRGEVPALLHDNVAIFDSTIILEYLEERWPEPALLPENPADRARVRMLEDAMDTHFEAITWGLSEVRYFGRGAGAVAANLESAAAAQLHAWYDWLAAQLDGRQWFNGAGFGWGDLCVVPFVNGAAGFGLTPAGPLGDWLERANARQSVAACRKAAQAVGLDGGAPSLEAVRAALEQGLFKREYRDHRLEWMVKSGGLAVVEDGIVHGNIRFIEPFK